MFHQDSSSSFLMTWLYNYYGLNWRAFWLILFFVRSYCVKKLAEQEKIAGELQKSLEQKDERMNGMQRKIEVCNLAKNKEL